MRASTWVELPIAIVLASISVAAAADPTGSTQPGATPVPTGNLLILRDVPARNAIISGAGAALSVPVAPPASVFDVLTGIGAPISDAQASSVTGSVSPGAGGFSLVSQIDTALGSQSMTGAASPDHAGGASMGGAITGAVQAGVAPLANLFGSLTGGGH